MCQIDVPSEVKIDKKAPWKAKNHFSKNAVTVLHDPIICMS